MWKWYLVVYKRMTELK